MIIKFVDGHFYSKLIMFITLTIPIYWCQVTNDSDNDNANAVDNDKILNISR